MKLLKMGGAEVDWRALRGSREITIEEHRPFKSWEDVEKVPGFSKGMIEDLQRSGASVGGESEQGKSQKQQSEMGPESEK